MAATQTVVGHAETLVHPGWPIAIDLHHEFPGFTKGADRAFDSLWERREPLEAAGVSCWAPDRLGALVVESLSSLRASVGAGSTDAEVERIIRTVEALPVAERESLARLAGQSGAAYAMAPVLATRGGAPRPAPSTSAELEWDLRTSGGGTLVSQAVAALYVGRGGPGLG
ncbi:hypothetical protein GCM10025873_25150 [Demequina sediminis]|uniref:hypothetical protein n=1 Tax=Demequina sediminis TaxID=1930058 RepID=UPI002573CF49|nr:hypothetical protein [Demequina sediminis]BDZ62724.1 hypothetical protein GCM10025873_25150 [Demequina sediminis]